MRWMILILGLLLLGSVSPSWSDTHDLLVICYDETQPLGERFTFLVHPPAAPHSKARCYVVDAELRAEQWRLLYRVPWRYLKIETFLRPHAVEMTANEKRLVDAVLAAQAQERAERLLQARLCLPRGTLAEVHAEQDALTRQIQEQPAQAVALLVDRLYNLAVCQALEGVLP